MTASPKVAEFAPEVTAALEREAEATTERRTLPGAIAGALATLAFSLAAPAGSLPSRLGPALVGATALGLALRLARRLSPVGPSGREGWRGPSRVASSLLVLGSFAAIVSAGVVDLGLGPLTTLMLVVHGGVIVGATATQSPRVGLMHASQAALLLPVAAAVLTQRGGVAGAMAVTLVGWGVFVVGFGRRMHAEYWAAARGGARLQAAGEELARMERQTRQVVERSPDAMGVARDGALVFVNAAWCARLGMSRDALLGSRLEDLAHPADLDALRAALRGDEGELPTEVRVRRGDGGYATWEVSPAQPVHESGERAVLVVARDVTERNRLRAQLQVAERMSALGTLAAGVAHEMNNPLSYVLLNVAQAREALRGGGSLADVDGVLGDAAQGAARVQAIVRDLRSFARVDEEHGDVEVAAALGFAVKVTAHALRPRARYAQDVPADLPRVRANEGRLAQVFVNLLVNAAQAIPEGAPSEHLVRVTAARDGDAVVVEVTDDGAGMSPEVLARAFDPFYTTKPQGLGVGLGLSMCHASMRAFGGEITAESDPGRATTFRLRLPRAPDAPAPEAVAPADDPARAPPTRVRVLIVDDEPGLLRSLARQVRPYGDATTVSGGAEALAALEGADFDAVLCDLMMPEMTGMELHARVRESRPALAARFVFMTGGAFTPESQAFVATTDRPVLEKPIDPARLRRELVATLAFAAT